MPMIRVRLFAQLKDLAGTDELLLEMPQEASTMQLREAIIQRIPSAERLVRHSLLAMNHELITEEITLDYSAAWALIPPVSGGACA